MGPPQLNYFTIKEPKNAKKNLKKLKKVIKMKEFGQKMAYVIAEQ